MKNLTFSELIDVSSLQMIQDSFSVFTGLAIYVKDTDGNMVTTPSGGTQFCSYIKEHSKEGADKCRECENYWHKKAYDVCETVFYTCHAGMTDIVVPIVFAGRIIGTIFAGQIRTDDIDKAKFKEKAKELGLDPDKYYELAKKPERLTKVQVERTVKFLSDFANALSALAYTNYQEIQKSKKMESVARSQASYVIGTTEELRSSMKEWIDFFKETTEKYRDMPEVTKETDAILSKGMEVYSVIDGVVDYIHLSNGNVDYAENIYDSGVIAEHALSSLKKEAEAAGVNIEAENDASLPKLLMGNSGRIGQMLHRLCSGIIKITEKGGKIGIFVACDENAYTCDLKIKITCTGTSVDEKTVKSIEKMMAGGAADTFKNIEKGKADKLDLPLVFYIMKQMSGRIDTHTLNNGNLVFTLTIPQLNGAKTSA